MQWHNTEKYETLINGERPHTYGIRKLSIQEKLILLLLTYSQCNPGQISAGFFFGGGIHKIIIIYTEM